MKESPKDIDTAALHFTDVNVKLRELLFEEHAWMAIAKLDEMERIARGLRYD